MAERRKEVMEWWSFLVKEIGVIRRKGSDILLWNGGPPTLWSVAEKRREPAVEEQNIGRKIPPLVSPMVMSSRDFMLRLSTPVVVW